MASGRRSSSSASSAVPAAAAAAAAAAKLYILLTVLSLVHVNSGQSDDALYGNIVRHRTDRFVASLRPIC